MSEIALGRVAELVTAKNGSPSFRIGLEAIEGATGRLLDVGADYESEGVAFAPGDLLFGKLRPYLAKAWLADRPGSAVGDFHVIRANQSRLLPRFLQYVALSRAFLDPVVSSVYGAKMPRVSWEFMRGLPIRVPDLAKQRRVADFLDRETAQIDTLIAKQEQLIVTLREQRKVALELAFGPAINAGDRLKWSLSEIDQRAGAELAALPLLSVSIAWGVRRRDEVMDDEPRADDLSLYKVAQAGDLVVNRMRAFQGALGVAPETGLVSPDYAVLRPYGTTSSNWLASAMRTSAFVGEMIRRLKGIGSTDIGVVRTPRINVSDLLDIALSIPSPVKQAHDFESARAETSRIDTLIAKTEQFIALARERRAALITAAVTGQIDVKVAV